MIDLTALPDNLKPFVDKITATAKPTIEMQLTPVEQPIFVGKSYWWHALFAFRLRFSSR
ncbi:Uncharacterised protein [Providencia stuartii]|nr:Uncharacterised protein [Providencia stuartii]